MATTDPGPLLSVLASEDPIGTGAASGSSDHCPADQQVGGALEGMQLTGLEAYMFSAMLRPKSCTGHRLVGDSYLQGFVSTVGRTQTSATIQCNLRLE